MFKFGWNNLGWLSCLHTTLIPAVGPLVVLLRFDCCAIHMLTLNTHKGELHGQN